jgi:hypothetical protein
MIEFIEYGTTPEGETLYARVDEDGLIRYTCVEADPAYQAWLNPQAEHLNGSVDGEAL